MIDTIKSVILPISHSLQIITTNLEELKEKVSFKIQKSDIPTTQKRKDKLQAENDLLIAELYGLTKEQLKHLSSPAYFKILNDKNKAYLSLLEE